jgi:hypothetical protein
MANDATQNALIFIGIAGVIYMLIRMHAPMPVMIGILEDLMEEHSKARLLGVVEAVS